MGNERDELERIEEFSDFLQGRVPDDISCQELPKMTAEQAFTVIWFLQVQSGFIPTNFEHCENCGEIFDSDVTGHYDEKSEINYCGAPCEGAQEASHG